MTQNSKFSVFLMFVKSCPCSCWYELKVAPWEYNSIEVVTPIMYTVTQSMSVELSRITQS